MTSHVRAHDGFTLLEVMVALAIGAMVLMMAHQLLAAVTEGSRRLEERVIHQDRMLNGRRWLRAALGSINAPVESLPFIGHPNELTLSASTLRGGGWFAPQRLRLLVHEDSLLVERSEEGILFLADSIERIDFDYLLEPGAETRWASNWISTASTPLAVRMRLKHRQSGIDTSLFMIMDRR